MKLSVNEKGLLANLESVFSDNTKVITELVQNARRAGARVINIQYAESPQGQNDSVTELCITDDGCGIDDLASLFTVAQSGWNDEVTHAENPYGMGFMSTLFAATDIEIKSNGQSLAFHTKDAIDGKDFGDASADGTAPKQGTFIRLKGMDFLESNLRLALKGASEYCETEIVINGEPAPRPYAFSETSTQEGAFVFETELGTAVMSSLSKSDPQVVQSGAIINTDKNGYANYMRAKNKKLSERREIDDLRNEIDELKNQLRQLLDR